MSPIVSIVIPVYNVEKYIRQCLLSIYNDENSLDLFEVIVVNDGTPDQSMKIVEEFRHYRNLRVIEQKNEGLSSARNTGMRNSTGDFIWFVDSDDWLLPSALKRIMGIVKGNTTIDLVITSLLWSYDCSDKNHGDLNIKQDEKIIGKDYLRKGFPSGAVQRYVTRRKILVDNSIFFPEGVLHEDAVWGREMLYFAREAYVLAQPLYAYRQRGDGSIMHSISVKSAFDLWRGHEMLMGFCKERVELRDQDWFICDAISLFISLYSFVEPIKEGAAFKDFECAFRRYKLHECIRCLKCKNSLKFKIKIVCLMLCPYFLLKLKAIFQ